MQFIARDKYGTTYNYFSGKNRIYSWSLDVSSLNGAVPCSFTFWIQSEAYQMRGQLAQEPSWATRSPAAQECQGATLK